MYRYISIDNNPVDNYACHKAIKKEVGNAEFHHFTNLEMGFQYLEKEWNLNPTPTILFLDLNWQGMEGADILSRFDKLDEKIKKQVSLFVYSPEQVGEPFRTMPTNNVVDYLYKPVIPEKIKYILEGLSNRSSQKA